jgi:hypothetical protein
MQAQGEHEPKPVEKILYEYHKPGYLGFVLRYYEYKDLVQLTFEDPNTRDRIWCMSNFCAAGSVVFQTPMTMGLESIPRGEVRDPSVVARIRERIREIGSLSGEEALKAFNELWCTYFARELCEFAERIAREEDEELEDEADYD